VDDTARPIGTVENGHVLTTAGWVILGTKAQGSVMTALGWAKDTPNSRPLGISIAIGAAGVLIGFIGVVMANASVSLLSGTGTNWTGAVITIIAAVSATLALVLLKSPLWTTIVTGSVGLLLVVIAMGSVIYLEVQLDQQRQDLSNILGN
jgi:hypothetical protein